MTVEEVRERRDELNDAIYDLMRRFTRDTGLNIASIEVGMITFYSCDGKMISPSPVRVHLEEL